MLTKHSSLVLGLLLAGLGTVKADTVLYDNLNVSGTAFVTFYLESQGYTSSGNQFATDGSGYTLSSVTLRLRPISDPSTISVKLFSDIGDNIGTGLYTIFAGAGPTSEGDVTYSGLSHTLAPNTKYWIVLDSDGDSPTTDWAYDSNDIQPAGVGTQPHGNSVSSDHGAGWTIFDAQPFGMQVTADNASVPEPGTVLVMLLGFAAFAARRHLCRN